MIVLTAEIVVLSDSSNTVVIVPLNDCDTTAVIVVVVGQ